MLLNLGKSCASLNNTTTLTNQRTNPVHVSYSQCYFRTPTKVDLVGKSNLFSAAGSVFKNKEFCRCGGSAQQEVTILARQ